MNKKLIIVLGGFLLFVVFSISFKFMFENINYNYNDAHADLKEINKEILEIKKEEIKLNHIKQNTFDFYKNNYKNKANNKNIKTNEKENNPEIIKINNKEEIPIVDIETSESEILTIENEEIVTENSLKEENIEAITIEEPIYNIQEKPENFIVPFYYPSERFANVVCEEIGLNIEAYQGDREDEMSKGAGHYVGSLFPGQGGHCVLASHRNGYFAPLQHIKEGMKVKTITSYGEFIYKVSKIHIVDKNEHSIANPTSSEVLTMYTCYPFDYVGEAPQRLVVVSNLIDSKYY